MRSALRASTYGAITDRGLADLKEASVNDRDARLVLADVYEEMGRPDVARLHRDDLPVVVGPDGEPIRRRPRVDHMTSDEEAMMKPWADRWIAHGLSTERADRCLFEASVRACYRHSGLDEPRLIYWVANPLAAVWLGALASLYLAQRMGDASVRDSVDASVDASVRASVDASVHASVRDSVDASVGASVGASVRDSVDASVGASVRDSVHASVDASVHASVRDSVDASVDASVRDSVRDSVDASVGASVRDSVRDSVDASVRDSVRASVDASVRDRGRSPGRIPRPWLETIRDTLWWRYMGGQFWAGWGYGWRGPAYVSFMIDVLGLDIGRGQELKARAYAATVQSACWWWPNKYFVIVSERPKEIVKYPDGRLRLARWDGFRVER